MEQGVRAFEILHDELRDRLPFVHQARWSALWRTVLAVIGGKQLWLTALGRARPGAALIKHQIKAVDRLLGNSALYQERPQIAAALAALLIRRRSTVVVLVDTVEIRNKVVGFVASVAHEGRSVPIWSTMITAIRANAKLCRQFLDELRTVLPSGCRPILVTDGGFETNWFDRVEALGWGYVGRIRGQTKFQVGSKRLSCADLHAMAGRHAKNLRDALYPLKRARKRRVVLSKLPVCRHRQIKTRTGPGRDTNYKHFRKNAYEPLILTTSLTCRPQAVVDVFATRMQIEQNFRDLKNHRWGWSLRHCGSRSKERVELLLLIGTIATFGQLLVGMAAEQRGIQRHYQANTVRSRRVLSHFVLGGLILARAEEDAPPPTAIRRALARLRRDVAELASFAR